VGGAIDTCASYADGTTGVGVVVVVGGAGRCGGEVTGAGAGGGEVTGAGAGGDAVAGGGGAGCASAIAGAIANGMHPQDFIRRV
jgi:hypothetical protein